MVKYLMDCGDEEEFDDSVKACEPFGFLAGQRVSTPMGEATVIGVYDKELYFHWDSDDGANIWDYDTHTKEDFEKAGFTLIIPPAETK